MLLEGYVFGMDLVTFISQVLNFRLLKLELSIGGYALLRYSLRFIAKVLDDIVDECLCDCSTFEFHKVLF